MISLSFIEMNSWKRSPVFKKWETNVNKYKKNKEKRQTLKKRSDKDMCSKGDFCNGAKDIPRKLMPQIYDAVAFAKKIKRKYNVDSELTKASMGDYKPSHNEINKDRVESVIADIKNKKLGNNPLVVSEDHYIIDGHHRWAAYKKYNPHKPIPVLIIKKPVREALGLAIAVSTNREHFG